MLTRAELGVNVPITIESELSFATSALGMVSANLGVSPMPGYVKSVLNPLQIVMVPIVEPSIENQVVLCTVEGRELSKAASIFREFLLAS